jgi:alcohol dehydrogenase class IV
MNNVFKNDELLFEEISRFKNVLILTSPGNDKRGYVREIITNYPFKTYVELVDNYPTLDEIFKIIKKHESNNFDLIISLGGGSVIDVSKILSISLHPQNIIDINCISKFMNFFNKQNISKIFHISIPTTSGSGAESTNFCTIWNFNEKKKYSIENKNIAPDQVYLLSKFLISLDFKNTLFPGLDAISHSFDSLFNLNATENSINLSLKSLKVFVMNFKKLLTNLDDENLRFKIHVASNLAGQSINLTKTSITHGLSYPLTINYGVPHGLACAIFIPILYEKYNKSIQNKTISNTLKEIRSLIIELNLENLIKEYTNNIDLDLYSLNLINSRIKNFSTELNQQDVNYIIKNIKTRIS